MEDIKKQKICTNFCFNIEKPGSETYEMLSEAFHNDAISRTQTRECYSCFNSDKNLEDPAHSGQKLSCHTEETLKKCINHLQRRTLYD